MRAVPLLPISEYDLKPPETKRKRLLQQVSAGTSQTSEDPGRNRQQTRTLTEEQQKLILTSQEVEDFLGNLK